MIHTSPLLLLLLLFPTRKLYINLVVDKSMTFNEVPTLAPQEINCVQLKVFNIVLLIKTCCRLK